MKEVGDKIFTGLTCLVGLGFFFFLVKGMPETKIVTISGVVHNCNIENPDKYFVESPVFPLTFGSNKYILYTSISGNSVKGKNCSVVSFQPPRKYKVEVKNDHVKYVFGEIEE